MEARWAVFFDSMHVKYEYEMEGFDLGNGKKYLPDFWLPVFGAWAEVKPVPLEGDGLQKVVNLVGGLWIDEYRDEPLIELVGVPDYKAYRMFCTTSIPERLFSRDCLRCRSGKKVEAILIKYIPIYPDMLSTHYWQGDQFYGYDPWKNEDFLKDEKIYADAVNAAKSARFEHGEHP
jgi:hypothetical protein